MTRLPAPLALIVAVACAPTYLAPGEQALDGVDRAAVCDPTMSVFPIAADHNIGYDHASCGTGRCEISCPDENANSDWGGDHHGIDVFAYYRAPLVAVTDGEVVAVGVPSSTSGLRVRIEDACGWEYYYGHLDEAVVSPGQFVRAGDLLGYMGHTGTASDHLHFNISAWGDYSNDINPFALLDATSPTACGAAPVEPPAPEPAVGVPTTPAGCGTLPPNTGLPPGGTMKSCDQRFSFVMQQDGNLVLYQRRAARRGGPIALWSSETYGNPGAVAWMQGDGNLVVYAANGRPLWDSQTWGHEGAALAVQDDGNVVIYDGNDAVWNTETCCR
jgi:hypothetical protein